MATYYWMGGTGAPTHAGTYAGSTAAADYAIRAQDYDTGGWYNDGTTYGTSNIHNFCWNVPGNWLIKVAGQTGNQGVSGGATGTNPGFYFEVTQNVPGGGDIAKFVHYRNDQSPYQPGGTGQPAEGDLGDHRIPQAPCLIGGYWNEEKGVGWLNAGNTSGTCQIVIEESWGDMKGQSSGQNNNGDANYLGWFVGQPVEKGYFANLGQNWLETYNFGRGTTFIGGLTFGNEGATGTINGLRVNASSVRDFSKGGYPANVTLLKSKITALTYSPSRTKMILPQNYANNSQGARNALKESQELNLSGGTLEQVFVDVAPTSGAFSVKVKPYEDWWNSGSQTKELNVNSLFSVRGLGGPGCTLLDEDGFGSSSTGDFNNQYGWWGNGYAEEHDFEFVNSGTVSYIHFTPPIRPRGASVWGETIQNLIVTPEEPRLRVVNTESPYKQEENGEYHPLFISAGFSGDSTSGVPHGCTIDILEMRDEGGYEDRNWITLQESDPGSQEINFSGLRGINNVVSVNFPEELSAGESVTIRDFQFEAGRFILGKWNNMGIVNPNEYPDGVEEGDRVANFADENNIRIDKGFINDKALFDGRCWDTPSWAGLKIGYGTTHPSDPSLVGFLVNSSDAEIILPVDMRVVGAYVNQDQGGVTIDPVLSTRVVGNAAFSKRK